MIHQLRNKMIGTIMCSNFLIAFLCKYCGNRTENRQMNQHQSCVTVSKCRRLRRDLRKFADHSLAE